MTKSELSKEKRVTAGLRGAAWNAALLPAQMHTSVHVLRTSDGAQIVGYLHAKGGEDAIAFFMHPRELLVAHYLIPYLVRAGIACWVQGPRTVGNDLRLEHELAIQDVAAGVVHVKERGYRNVVLVGNSGGASLFAFYQEQSRLVPTERLAKTPAGRPTKLEATEMPAVDGFVFLAPHPGQGKLLQDGIDPSVTDENDPFSIDPALDPFSAANGFRPAEEGGAHYAPSFITRYREAQAARVARIDAKARAMIVDRRAARDAGGGKSPRSTYAGIFTVWRTDADLRCFDLSLDPSDRKWGSVWGADPIASNYGSVGFGRVCTPESWLSTWSSLSSRASFDRCGSAIDKPSLLIEYTGDNTVFPKVADAIFDRIGARDKTRIRIRGNHHGQPLDSSETIPQQEAARCGRRFFRESLEEGVISMMGVEHPIPGIVYPPPERLQKYVESGELPATTLTHALMSSFEKHRARVALFTPEGPITYAELDSITDRFAAALHRLGLRPLDRALFQAGNSKEIVFAILGCLKAGVIPICTLAAHRESEIVYLGCHADARLHIVQGDDRKTDLVAFAQKTKPLIPTLDHIVSLRGAAREGAHRFEDLILEEDPTEARALVASIARDPFQVAIFQLSGGTTGTPKIIPRMQNDYLLNAQRTATWLGFRETDVLFMPMPIIHNACMVCFLLPSLLTGSAFAIAADMSPEAWGVTFHSARPTFVGLIRPLFPRLEAMLERELATLDHVRAFWSADGAKQLREKYGILSYGMFGMSEGLCMYTKADDPEEARDWTVGVPLSRFDEARIVRPGTNIEVGIGEVGELLCRGPYTLSGYYNAPERNKAAFTEDGFYRTGDLMVLREIDGRVFHAFAGRTKDVVDRGSEKINCEEVEKAIAGHSAVREVAVIGMPDAKLGERVCAYVVAREGHEPPTVAAFARHLEAQGLARFKWPERVEIVAALATTKVGKLDKAAMRSDVTKKLEKEAADLRLAGVHHAARPTWRLKETIEFYRDVLGLPLIHAVSARGWGRTKHPDFLHFFFDSGHDSTIAFFYYVGTEQPDHLVHRPEYDSDASHVAWRVNTRSELLAWRRRLEERGVSILYQIEHEVIESIYFRDPNGYYLEITYGLRPLTELDALDAQATLDAAIALEQQRVGEGHALTSIEAVWRKKGESVRQRLGVR